MPANLENSAMATALEIVFIPIPMKGNAKKMFKPLQNCTHFTC